MITDDGLLFIVCGPSGVGKTTLCDRLLTGRERLMLSVSYTTRAPRPGESDGEDYHYVDIASFEERRDDDEFAEWAAVHGNYYGTSVAVIEAAWAEGRDVLFDIDYQGAAQLKERFPGRAVATLVVPPSMEELERRLRSRATDAEEVISRRMAAARDELSKYMLFDYLLENDDLDETFEELCGIYDASRHLRSLHEARMRQMLEV